MSRYLPLLSGIAIGVLLAVACHTDYKKRIIPNAIPILILAAGFFTSGSFLMKFVNLAAMVLIIVVAERRSISTAAAGISSCTSHSALRSGFYLLASS